MLVLKVGRICPFAAQCIYNQNGQCWGAKANRNHTFSCEYVDVDTGKILEGGTRIPGDKTGKMKVILE